MKKKIILMLSTLSMLTSSSFAQECKYKVQDTDKFTGISQLELSPVVLSDKLKSEAVKIGDIKMILYKKGSERTFGLSFKWIAKGMPMFASTGPSPNMLICLLDNNEKVELPMVGMAPDFKKTTIIVHFQISDDAFDILSSHKITDIRAVAAVNAFDFQVEEGVNTTESFKCIK